MIADGSTQAVIDMNDLVCCDGADGAVDLGGYGQHRRAPRVNPGAGSGLAGCCRTARDWVTRQFDAPLQSSGFLTNQTIQALAEKIASRSKKVVNVAA